MVKKCSDCFEEDIPEEGEEDYKDCLHFSDGLCCFCAIQREDREVDD